MALCWMQGKPFPLYGGSINNERASEVSDERENKDIGLPFFCPELLDFCLVLQKEPKQGGLHHDPRCQPGEQCGDGG